MKIENANGIITVALDDINVAAFKLDDETRESLLAGQEISEEAAENVVTIFEAAVNGRVREIQEAAQNQLTEAVNGAVESIQESVQEHVSNYLRDVVIEEWMETNKVAIAANVTSENNATLVEGIIGLLKTHYVEVPEERRDLVQELGESVTAHKAEIAALEESNLKLRTQLNGAKCDTIFKSLASDLTESEVEKFETLVEDLSIDDVETFERKATVIRNTFFKKSNSGEEGEKAEAKADASKTELKEEKNDDEGKSKKPSVIELASRTLRRSN